MAVQDWDDFASDDAVIAEAKGLVAQLEEVGLQHPGESYFVAGYDPPFRLTHLHSEVWIPVVLEDM